MRYILCLIALADFVALGWFAMFTGSDVPYLRGAPQIAMQIETEAAEIVENAGHAKIRVAVDGRSIHLSGEAATQGEIDSLVRTLADISIASRLTHDIAIVPTPGEAGGSTPTDAVAVSEDAEGTFSLAARVTPSDTQSPGTAPQGQQPAIPEEISQRFPDGVYHMQARKTVDGTILLSGKVPDASTIISLISAAEALSDVPLIVKLDAAEDFPSTVWLNMNRQGLEALAWMESGDLSTVGPDLSLRGTVQTLAEREQLMAFVQPEWVLDVTVLNTEPDAEITLNLTADGSITGSGSLPKGLTSEQFADLLPGLSANGFSVEGAGRDVDWTAALDGLSIVLPRLDTAEIRIKHTRFSLSGILKDGYSADGLEASLRTAMNEGWTLSLEVEAPPPESELILTKADDVVSLGGVLPRGLTPADALALFGESAGGSGLTEGGFGEAGEWRNALIGTAEMLDLFTEATGSVSEGKIALTGTLRSGYDAKSVHAWQSARTGANWQIEVGADTAPASDGDTRRVLVEDGDGFAGNERFISGYWLPILDFAPSVETCTAQTEAHQASGKITFITSSARFDQDGKDTLDRLAAILQRCAGRDGVKLEIGGHTDSVGNDAANLRLSEKRAQVVLDEMVKRGVRADLMSAVGYGEDEPIASNNTAEGRARNRRITFNWSETSQ